MSTDGSGSGPIREKIPGYTFLRNLERQVGQKKLAALGTALGLLLTDPATFIRVFLLEALVVIVIDGFFGGVETVLQAFSQSYVAVGRLFWAATFGVIVDIIRAFADAVMLPLIGMTQQLAEGVLLQLGVAAPMAVAVSLGITTLVFVLIGVVLYEIAATYVPLDAIVRGIRAPLGGLLTLATGAWSAVKGIVVGFARLPGRFLR